MLLRPLNARLPLLEEIRHPELVEGSDWAPRPHVAFAKRKFVLKVLAGPRLEVVTREPDISLILRQAQDDRTWIVSRAKGVAHWGAELQKNGRSFNDTGTTGLLRLSKDQLSLAAAVTTGLKENSDFGESFSCALCAPGQQVARALPSS